MNFEEKMALKDARKEKITRRICNGAFGVIGLASLVATAGMLSDSCTNKKTTVSEPENSEVRNKIEYVAVPKVQSNQTLFLHPKYLNHSIRSGYTLLTDIDSDGKWDAAEKVYWGLREERTDTVFFKKGYGPAQSMPEGINVKYVNPEYFKPYQ